MNDRTSEGLRRLGIASWSILGGSLVLAAAIWLMIQVRIAWLPIVITVALVYVLNPLVTWLHGRRIHRLVGAFAAYILFFGTITLAGILIAPILRDQGAQFAEQLPAFVDSAVGWFRDVADRLGFNLLVVPSLEAVQEWLADPANQETVRSFITGAGGFLAELFRGVFEFVVVSILGLVVAFYVLIDLPSVRERAKELLPAGFREEALHISRNLGTALGGFIRGQLLVALIVGILSSLGMAVINLPFWLLIGMIAGILNIVPFIGPWVGGSLAALVAILSGDPAKAFLAVAIFTGIQQFDNHVVTPSIMRATIKLHPGLMLMALLLGGSLGGFLGVLVAVPLTAMLKILIGHFWRTRVLGESWAEASEAAIVEYEPPSTEKILARIRGIRDMEVHQAPGGVGEGEILERSPPAADPSETATDPDRAPTL